MSGLNVRSALQMLLRGSPETIFQASDVFAEFIYRMQRGFNHIECACSVETATPRTAHARTHSLAGIDACRKDKGRVSRNRVGRRRIAPCHVPARGNL
jgi:hypothetical protein